MTRADPQWIGSRYRIINRIGAGGMGVVHRATDRLTGHTVALKQVTVSGAQLQFASMDASSDFRLALAQEFKTLASLRHPNIISVLDYGFDQQRRPYFTMELLDGARTIIEAGRGQPLAVQVELLVQMLQALDYLHRRGVIHRDLKPDNVLVIHGRVKVLDFGLAVAREHLEESQATVGTIAYMAPEVLKGSPASESADLYAVGLIAYELLAGGYPFDSETMNELINNILNTTPDLDSLPDEPWLREVLARLLFKSPDDRYQDAHEVITLLGEGTGQETRYETAVIRESFLQAARFVGRETEMALLKTSLQKILDGTGRGGSAWLVGGESGVGKSRLLDELRAQALVAGALVPRGQAITEGGAPYLLWRDVLRRLCLQTDLSDLEAGVLKGLVPDIEKLLDREVPDAPEIDPQSAQIRTLTVIEDLFRRQREPIVVLLEDLQWATESLIVLNRLSQRVAGLPLLLIGSYRDDERPELPEDLPAMQVLKLGRLAQEDIAELSASMLGDAGQQPSIVEFLQRETEGNVFFLVEVVRVLAEDAGQLDRVADLPLPERVFAGGIKTVVHRRLSRVPGSTRPLLQLAAVAGRQLDLQVMRLIGKRAASGQDIEDCLTACAEISVLEVQDGQWRFAHDKLREALLDELSLETRSQFHRRVARAIEEVYPEAPEQVAVLAYHWSEAEDSVQEARYAALAGEQALSNGVFDEAVSFLERAIALHGSAGTPRIRRAQQERLLGEAYLGLGQLRDGRSHAKRSVALIGFPSPAGGGVRLGLSLFRQTVRQIGHRAGLGMLGFPAQSSAAKTVALEAARAYELLALIDYFGNDKYAAIHSTIANLNLAERLGESTPELARACATMAMGAGLAGIHPLARLYLNRAQATVQEIDHLPAIAYVYLVNGVYHVGIGQWEAARAALGEAISLFDQLGDRVRWGQANAALGQTYYWQGEFEHSLHLYTGVGEAAYQSHNAQHELWGLVWRAENLIRQGHIDRAAELIDAALPLLADNADHASEITTYGVLALVRWRQNQLELAREAVEIAARVARESAPTSFYSLDGYACLAEVVLALWEAQPDHADRYQPLARLACKALHRYARVFPAGKARASLSQGRYHKLAGRSARAHRTWNKALRVARRLALHYEEGLIRYEIGRHLPEADPQRRHQLGVAIEIFQRLGADWDLQQVNALFER